MHHLLILNLLDSIANARSMAKESSTSSMKKTSGIMPITVVLFCSLVSLFCFCSRSLLTPVRTSAMKAPKKLKLEFAPITRPVGPVTLAFVARRPVTIRPL